MSLLITPTNIRSMYRYIEKAHHHALAVLATLPDGALRLATQATPYPEALLMFTQPTPTIVRATSPDDIRIGSPGLMLAVPFAYEELRPSGETWRSGRLTALRWLHRMTAQYPLEAVTVHDGTVTRDWLASERDLFLLVRESA